jgi:hypothetical protein
VRLPALEDSAGLGDLRLRWEDRFARPAGHHLQLAQRAEVDIEPSLTTWSSSPRTHSSRVGCATSPKARVSHQAGDSALLTPVGQSPPLRRATALTN